MTDHQVRLRAARRRFLLGAGAASAAALSMSPFGRLLASAAVPRSGAPDPAAGYGRLRPVRDLTTDLPLLHLPEGFRYRTFGWAGEPLADGTPCPGAHDGMGVVRARGSRLTLVRNHEVVRLDGAFGPVESQYDRRCSGGTVTLEFDTDSETLQAARPSLSGTIANCSGGVTPWGTWLSCEEFVSRAGVAVRVRGEMVRLSRDHGFVFEVPADGLSAARPLRAMGQFRHEAAVVHAASGDVYLTEDAEPTAGFYRFVPATAGRLADGGRLQMLRVRGRSDLRSGLRTGERMPADFVDIEHPARGFEPGGGILGVQRQGIAAGASVFTRLEGCIATDEEVFFVATNGGDAGCGQVFAWYPAAKELMLLFEPADPAQLDYPDNVVVSPRGGLLLCQDSGRPGQRLHGLGRDGELFVFAQQNVVLDGARGFSGDYRSAEWAGACFSPDGRWLFANVFSPGFSVAITGPWRDGLV
jgi:uncharacterized protein